jgi:hypothetical protein
MATEIMQAQVAELAENQAALEQQRILNSMLVRSATDKEFRALMLADSRAAFAACGVELPAGVDVRFIENKYDATIVLPNAIDDMAELSEEELAQLNGGALSLAAVVDSAVKISAISTMACAGAVVSVGAVALTIYLAT